MTAAPARPRHHAIEGHDARHPDDAGIRRRWALLLAALALPTVLVLAGPLSAWPLFAVPLAVALPLGGPRAMAVAIAVAGLALALVSGRPEADGAAMGIGLGTFVVTGAAVGAAHLAQERRAERIASQSLTDRLTGVHNYAFFADALPRECRRADRYGLRLSLVLLDLDHFKAFNDAHGHDAGNRLLAAVGQAIRASARSTDVAARFGGEEFALIVPGPATEAMEAAERIRDAVGRVRVPVSGGGVAGTTISAGVAELGEEADGRGEGLLERADRALYRSKEHGRDRISLHQPEGRTAVA